MMVADKCYIIIVTYNGMQWISKSLKSCDSSNVIVIDNNSKDGTVAFIKENFPKIVLLEQAENLGFGAANNIGMSYALKNKADFVFLLNQDAYLQPKVIESLISVHKNNIEYGILSPIHLNGRGSKFDKNFYNYLRENDDYVFDAVNKNYVKDAYQVPFVNAAAWLLPRKTLECIGGFDPIFNHYAEDDNYCQRVLFHDFKVGVVPDIYINHDRENRKSKQNVTNEERLVLKERYLKFRWANINVEVKEDIERHKKDLLKLIVKLYLKLKFNKVSFYKKELALIKRILPGVLQSRRINLKQGSHYL